MHTTNQLYLTLKHEGAVPPSWGMGDEHFQKAKFIAMVTWSLIKDSADPELPACDLTFQEQLVGEVEGLLAGNSPGSRFGVKAAELISELPPEQLKR